MTVVVAGVRPLMSTFRDEGSAVIEGKEILIKDPRKPSRRAV